MTTQFDALVIGAGAAGLFCAAEIGRTGKRVHVIDHARKPAEKVRISGGGRCNFTNLHTRADRFLSENRHFAKSALARYTPSDFCDLMSHHGLTWHEKTLGQLFCDTKSAAIIKMLLDELDANGGTLALETHITQLEHTATGFRVTLSDDVLETRRLVIATGGLSIPKMGATGFAYDIARQFGHDIVLPKPGLVPFTFSGALKDVFADLSGVSTPATIKTGDQQFSEAILFTHRGLSGPAILQASSYWKEGMTVQAALLPDNTNRDIFLANKRDTPKRTLASSLSDHLPRRLVDALTDQLGLPGEYRLADLSDTRLTDISDQLQAWSFTPTGTEGWRTAEVTVGGVSTSGLSSKTMESRHLPGLYFIGECVDVTGWLGGYNFQWAWASAMAAGRHIGEL